jgi:hypothetical protein
MQFGKAVQILGIEEYKERIWNSNSHGELFFLTDYIQLAEMLGDQDNTHFKAWFKDIVEMAEQTWKRPESVFQHVIKSLNDTINHPKYAELKAQLVKKQDEVS